jgi:hypothetical protein
MPRGYQPPEKVKYPVGTQFSFARHHFVQFSLYPHRQPVSPRQQAGLFLQNRLQFLHHQNAPARPQQVEYRLIRQGIGGTYL